MNVGEAIEQLKKYSSDTEVSALMLEFVKPANNDPRLDGARLQETLAAAAIEAVLDHNDEYGSDLPFRIIDGLRDASSALARDASVTSLPPLSDRLPCDVLLPPNTIIARGAPVSLLLTALKKREEWPDGECRILSASIGGAA